MARHRVQSGRMSRENPVVCFPANFECECIIMTMDTPKKLTPVKSEHKTYGLDCPIAKTLERHGGSLDAAHYPRLAERT